MTDKCTYCTTPLSRAENGKCAGCGAPTDHVAQVQHQQYLDSKYGVIVRRWFDALLKTPGGLSYDEQTRLLEYLEHLQRMLHEPPRPVKHFEYGLELSRAWGMMLQELRARWKLDLLLYDFIELVKTERIDQDIARRERWKNR